MLVLDKVASDADKAFGIYAQKVKAEYAYARSQQKHIELTTLTRWQLRKCFDAGISYDCIVTIAHDIAHGHTFTEAFNYFK